VPGGGEDAHVGADLGDQQLGRAPLHAGHRAQQLSRLGERADLFLDRVCQLLDLLVEEVQVREDRADQQRVQRLEAALQRLAQRWELLAQLAASQLGEHVGVGRAGDQRVEHRAAALAEDVGRDAVELDPGVFQRLVQPLRLALALGDLRAPI
jgi:DNA anti-recombination protein RmuC